MTPLRLFAVVLIFILATVAWMVLGTTNLFRTNEAERVSTEKVAGLFGRPQTQQAPRFTVLGGSTNAVEVASTVAKADFKLDQRRKGLLWFATYKVDFAAAYGVKNDSGAAETVQMTFKFPSADGVYDGFKVLVDGDEVPVEYGKGEAIARFSVPANGAAQVATGYRTGGMNSWTYVPTPDGAGIVRDFSLTMTTDFGEHDFADGSISPSKKTKTDSGWKLEWEHGSIISGRPISLVMPKPANPGPIAYRISYFAPVSLLFFFAGLVLLTATQHVRLHPVHYGFLAAAFFAFHLLLSYLADQIPMAWAFGIASAASVALVVGYLSAVLGRNRVLAEVGVSQFIFLVLFSYSFFFEGLTGLAVTIGSVVTLAFFMAKTARLDWEEVFRRQPRQAPAIQPAPIVEPTG